MVDEVCQKVKNSCLPPGEERENSSSIMIFFGFYSRRGFKSCDLSTTQDGETSSCLKEYEEIPCADEDPTIKNLVVGSVENEWTSNFFVSDLQITDIYVGSCMGGETPFCIISNTIFQIKIIVTFGAT